MGLGKWRASRLWAWSALALGASVGCSFPDFVAPRGNAGANASNGATANNDPGGAATQGATGGAEAGSSVGPSGGSSVSGNGNGGSGGKPVPVDIGPCGQRPHPTHCGNHQQDDDETDVDCGGPRCAPCAADQTCVNPDDCASGACTTGQCERSFSLQYVQQLANEESTSFRMKAVLSYSGKAQLLLSDVTLRYYFSRNSVTEPILPSGSVFQLPEQTDISSSASFSIGRQLRGDGISNDAYLEVGFKKGKIVTEGQALEISGGAITGDGSSLFNQKTHYSFDPATSLHETKKLTVYVKGQRVWGQEPAVDDPPSCFHLGVNLDGPALTVGGNAWLTSPASVLARYINSEVVFKPDTDDGRVDMMRAGFFFHDDSFSYAYPVENGSYALLAYAWSANGSEQGTLTVQGEERDTFQATSFAGGGPWVALGPYRVTVTDGQIELAAKGDLRIGGLELRVLDE